MKIIHGRPVSYIRNEENDMDEESPNDDEGKFERDSEEEFVEEKISRDETQNHNFTKVKKQ